MGAESVPGPALPGRRPPAPPLPLRVPSPSLALSPQLPPPTPFSPDWPRSHEQARTQGPVAAELGEWAVGGLTRRQGAPPRPPARTEACLQVWRRGWGQGLAGGQPHTRGAARPPQAAPLLLEQPPCAARARQTQRQPAEGCLPRAQSSKYCVCVHVTALGDVGGGLGRGPVPRNEQKVPRGPCTRHADPPCAGATPGHPKDRGHIPLCLPRGSRKGRREQSGSCDPPLRRRASRERRPRGRLTWFSSGVPRSTRRSGVGCSGPTQGSPESDPLGWPLPLLRPREPSHPWNQGRGAGALGGRGPCLGWGALLWSPLHWPVSFRELSPGLLLRAGRPAFPGERRWFSAGQRPAVGSRGPAAPAGSPRLPHPAPAPRAPGRPGTISGPPPPPRACGGARQGPGPPREPGLQQQLPSQGMDGSRGPEVKGEPRK